jgi:hypothetical protein
MTPSRSTEEKETYGQRNKETKREKIKTWKLTQ